MPHKILPTTFERNDQRGVFREILNEGQWEALIAGRMNPQAIIGNHYHKKTVIFFHISKGAASIKTINIDTGGRDDFLLHSGQGVILPTNESHAIRFLEESDFIMLKSVKYDPADPDTFEFPVED
jgi:quercetin dioxygenase-like cupin family protein